MVKDNQKVIIIGCGMAGLAAAMQLSKKGLEVEVHEKATTPGGKLRAINSSMGPIDAGPTVFTLKPWFDEFFSELGERFDDHVTISEQSVLARHWWPDESRLDLRTDLHETLSAIKEFSGKKSALEFETFYRKTKMAFDIFEMPIMKSSSINPVELIMLTMKNRRAISDLLFTFKSLWEFLAKEFSDPRLRQLFARYATYVGTSPLEAPALLSLVWQAEARGVWQILGGMHTLPKVMETLARKNGAEFKYKSEINSIQITNGTVQGVTDQTNRLIKANSILFNGDPAAIYKGMLGEDVRSLIKQSSVKDRSLSAFVWSFTSKPIGKDLSLHNVFFNSDYTSEFHDIKRGKIPRTPSIYVCAQDRGISPNIGGPERFEIIINAAPNPNENYNSDKRKEFEKCKEITFHTLQKMGLKFLQSPEMSNLSTPSDYQKMFPGSDGSIYGLNLSKTMATFKRPKVKTKIRGLYLAGGGVHPGPGVPMALSSGKHAAEMILKDHSLI